MNKCLSTITAITIATLSLTYGGAAVLASETIVPAEEYDTPIEGEGMLTGPSEPIQGEGMLTGPSEASEGSSVFSSSAEPTVETIEWNPEWQFANYSVIHTGAATLYRSENGNGFTVCVNAGHGTAGGESAMTMCHPDGTPKVTGGSTAAGATQAIAVSSGCMMADGRPEGMVNLSLALILKEKLLAEGFNVLMIRESDDVQLDNIARSVIANQNADCHLAIHYDSSDSDKGFFCITVPDVASYRAMEPVASHYQQHLALAECLINGQSTVGTPLFSGGMMPLDLTQTSYSTVPSVDVECGDRISDCSPETQSRIADGLVLGLKAFFGV